MKINLKFGKELITINLDDSVVIDTITPILDLIGQGDQIHINFFPLEKLFIQKKIEVSRIKVGIALNDKTRPVPYSELVPTLINKLLNFGIIKQNISFYISNGTHVPDYDLNHLHLSDEYLNGFNFFQHDSNDNNNLIFLGKTSFNTPIIVNRSFYECDFKISIGNIEPHHFAGYSGGVKTVAIGLAGWETINHNHSLLSDPNSVICEYTKNKVRMDIEEIGDIIGVDLALNCILSDDKRPLMILFDHPKVVMEKAIPIINNFHTIKIDKKYDLVIASAGGYPKDINFYQSQKAASNASKLLKPGGSMLLIAECIEGHGSDTYINFVKKFKNPFEIIHYFENHAFVIGQHKAFLMAKIQSKFNVHLFSRMPQDDVKSLLMEPVSDIKFFIEKHISGLKTKTIAFMPNAVTTIPIIDQDES